MKYAPLELIEIIHCKDRGGCGHTAFLYNRRPHQGEIASYLNAYNLDGTRPQKNDFFKCGSCEKDLSFKSLKPKDGWAPDPFLGFFYCPYIPLMIHGDPPNPQFPPKEDGSDSTIPYGEH